VECNFGNCDAELREDRNNLCANGHVQDWSKMTLHMDKSYYDVPPPKDKGDLVVKILGLVIILTALYAIASWIGFSVVGV
jgi:hypothetical protein